MEPKDGKGPGDEQRSPGRKRAPSARKRAPKAERSAEQDGGTATEREVAPQKEPRPAPGASAMANRSTAETGGSPQPVGERAADLGDADERNYVERDAERAVDVAADLKSWMDARREDRNGSREVL